MRRWLCLTAAASVVLWTTVEASGASCPYCGRGYGEAAPGDWARVEGLRRQHEANCPSRPRSGGRDRGRGRTRRSRPNPAIQAYNRGLKHYKAERWGQAAAEFRWAAGRLPRGDSDGWRLLGICLEQQGKYDEAIEAYRKATRRNWLDAKARRRHARLSSWLANREGVRLSEQDDWKAAADRFRRALRHNPKNDTARKNLKTAREILKRRSVTEQLRKMAAEVADEIGKPAPSRSLTFAAYYDGLYDPAVVDLRGVPDASGGRKRGAAPEAAGSPRPHRPLTSALDEKSGRRQRRIRSLSDKELTKRIEHTQKLLEDMKGDFAGKSKQLKVYLSKAQEAERAAVLKSIETALGAMPPALLKRLDMLDPAVATNAAKVRDAVIKAHADLAKGTWDYATGPKDREAKLRAAKDVLQAAYSALSDLHKKVGEHGPVILSLTSYLVDYSYEATRWNVARTQMNRIIDNMDRPGGELDAQKALIRLQKGLIAERKRRRAEPAWLRRTGRAEK